MSRHAGPRRRPRSPAGLGLLALALCLTACGDKPKPQPVAKPPASAKHKAPAAPLAHAATQAAAAEAAQYQRQRRKPLPAVIGGCAEACATPEAAAGALLTALGSPEPAQAARQLFDWSLLEVDGDAHGERWAELWGDVRKHDERNRAIATWLSGWLAQFKGASQAQLAASRARGVSFRKLPGRSDVMEMRWRPPVTKRGEREWRVLWTLRGYEWLISRVDHEPGKRSLGDPPRGSRKRGHL